MGHCTTITRYDLEEFSGVRIDADGDRFASGESPNQHLVGDKHRHLRHGPNLLYVKRIFVHGQVKSRQAIDA